MFIADSSSRYLRINFVRLAKIAPIYIVHATRDFHSLFGVRRSGFMNPAQIPKVTV